MKRASTDYIVVHCSATPATMNIGADQIREWHVNDNHWADIGYHYVIRRDGKVENGRPEDEVGAGVKGHNHNSVHICLVGGLDRHGNPEVNYTPEQWRSLHELVKRMSQEDYPTAEVVGHRDFPGVEKACPCFDVKHWWKTMENAEYLPDGHMNQSLKQ